MEQLLLLQNNIYYGPISPMANGIKSLHREKFKDFIALCEKSPIQSIIVANIDTIGNSYAEMLINIAIATKHNKTITVVNGGDAFTISGPLK